MAIGQKSQIQGLDSTETLLHGMLCCGSEFRHLQAIGRPPSAVDYIV
jgi:hypothetical protein